MEITVIEWEDAYGAISGWKHLDDFKPAYFPCLSCGIKVYENDRIVALAPNYAKETEYTAEQANGIMVIPKSSILKSTTFSFSYPGSESKQPQQPI